MSAQNNKFIVIIILAVIFGFSSGIVGELIARVYLFENDFNIPYFGEINLSQDYNGGSSIIIRDAKKVVVEQDTKIEETINAATVSMFDLYEKIGTSTIDSATGSKGILAPFNLSNNYLPQDRLAAGFIITSDGWIISDYIPAGLKTEQVKNKEQLDNINKKIYDRYVFVAGDKKIYPVDNIIVDKLTNYAFWHVNAIDLPVRQFAAAGDILNGRSVIAVNSKKWALLSTIMGQTYNGGGLIRSSDLAKHKLILEDKPDKQFSGSFLFGIGGDLIGLIDKSDNVYAITNFIKPINSLLKNRTIARVSLGVNYIDLSELTTASGGDNGAGALIYKNEESVAVAAGSPAEKAGLKEGDIIISIDNIELDKKNNLTDLVSKYLPGDVIIVNYLRDGIKKEAEIKLAELK